MIKNKLLDKALLAKYPESKGFRTHVISGVINIADPEAPILVLEFMSRTALTNYIEQRGYRIEMDLFPELTDIRGAIRWYEKDEEEFMEHQAKRKQTNSSDAELNKALAELNPELFGELET